MSEQTPVPKRSAWPLLLLATAFLSPFLAAVVMRFGGWQPTSTRNVGELIQPPVSMHEVSARRADDGSAWSFENTEQHWSLLLRLPSPCNADCTATLELVRNVGVSMGRHQSRISFWQIDSTEDSPFSALVLDGPRPDAWTAAPSAPEVWLVDPHGYLVLHYPAGFDPRGLRRDLGRLIK
ncbi:MAG: hypothetical protein KDJ14_12910 [Xanthomonadales bacterium]|nr:hypothetical protein [Xanthomonadales bacterium]